MKVLVVDSGARGHTLAWKLAQSPKVKELYVAPGNAGTATIAENWRIDPTDIRGLVGAAKDFKIDLVVVGPEAPLVGGLANACQAVNIPVFGPTAGATLIESSKCFSAELMAEYGIPHAPSQGFDTFARAKRFLTDPHNTLLADGIVVKGDGLAAGKGVVVTDNVEEALTSLENFMLKRTLPGSAGNRVLICQRLRGREMSVMGFTDGQAVKPIVPACDYKPVFDDDQGPYTGGMGSYAPSEFIDPVTLKRIVNEILLRAVQAMETERKPYKGVLYGGLRMTDEGPKTQEFNARFGDPETQVQLPLLKTDLVDIMLAVINGTLSQLNIEWSDEVCVGVVMASVGYPGTPKTNLLISGLDKVDPDILVFHAGTKLGEKPGEILTAGGRVLTVVATGKTITEARKKVYANVPRIQFEGCHYRKDIGLGAEIAEKPFQGGD